MRYTPDADQAAVRAELAGLPGVVAFRDVRGSEETVRQLLGLFYAIVGVMLLFGSILAFVVLFNTLSVNIAERTVELATLRAAGGRVSTLARMMTAENLVLVAAAIPAGLAAGWLDRPMADELVQQRPLPAYPAAPTDHAAPPRRRAPRHRTPHAHPRPAKHQTHRRRPRRARTPRSDVICAFGGVALGIGASLRKAAQMPTAPLHHPVVVEHAARRAADVQLRIADASPCSRAR